jgi:hypothetical protein
MKQLIEDIAKNLVDIPEAMGEVYLAEQVVDVNRKRGCDEKIPLGLRSFHFACGRPCALGTAEAPGQC